MGKTESLDFNNALIMSVYHRKDICVQYNLFHNIKWESVQADKTKRLPESHPRLLKIGFGLKISKEIM